MEAGEIGEIDSKTGRGSLGILRTRSGTQEELIVCGNQVLVNGFLDDNQGDIRLRGRPSAIPGLPEILRRREVLPLCARWDALLRRAGKEGLRPEGDGRAMVWRSHGWASTVGVGAGARLTAYTPGVGSFGGNC